jgi:hypothetical protein
MRHLAPAEPYCYLHPVTYFDKLTELSEFDIIVTVLGARPKLYFLDVHLALLLALIVQLLLLLEPELAVVHQTADWRFRIGHQLNQIDPGCFRHTLGLFQRQNAFLFAIFGNQPNFRRGYILVETALFVVCDWGFSR